MIATTNPTPTVRSLLTGKSILLTGSTGFIAKAFLEKLLRTIPEVGRVHLLIRAQDAGHSLSRAEHDIFSSSIFDHLKSKDSASFHKLVEEKVRFVIGDTSHARLGLHASDYLRLSQDVDVV